jgi:AraC-like DNA-binding protein/mannose-6-phosphate isomerase-like protein (cupin superfamily)
MLTPPGERLSGHPTASGVLHLSGCPTWPGEFSHVSEACWERAFTVVEPQINAAGIHQWPFNPSFPIDVRFFMCGGPQNIRMNRHDYFELMYVYEGSNTLDVQDQCLRVRAGDLIVMGSQLFHRVVARNEARAAVLFFLPELIRSGDNAGEDVEYLLPLLLQGAGFPHIVGPDSGIPDQVHDLMMRIFAQLPAVSSRARLSVKTYLKMILILLVNHYSEYTGARETLDRRRRDLERLQPLFDHLEKHYQEKILLRDAAKLCGMSNSHFMFFFKKVTGQSFLSYHIHFRIAKAQVLLINTDMSVSEISQDVGFCDQSHLGLAFRNLVGVTPLAYRLRFGNCGRTQSPIRADRSLVPKVSRALLSLDSA